jgi:hypothetical protein
MSAPRKGRPAALGLLAGLVAGLAMTLVMLVLRLLAGISPPLEMIPDRFAPTLTIDQFFGLFAVFGGYNGLKQFGVSSVLTGMLTVSALLGLACGLTSRRAAVSTTSAARVPAEDRFLIVVVGVLWIASLGILWPTLGSSYIGLAPSAAGPVTAVGLLAAYAAYGLTLRAAFRTLARPTGAHAQPSTTPATGGISRRVALVAGIGAVLGVASAAVGRRLWDLASFAYDGTRFSGPLAPVTPNDQFYVVTKNVVDPQVSRDH